MNELTYRVGFWLYEQCVFFVIHVADVLGITYRDSNALLFFVVWPAVTVFLAGWVVWNWVVLLSTGRVGPGPARSLRHPPRVGDRDIELTGTSPAEFSGNAR